MGKKLISYWRIAVANTTTDVLTYQHEVLQDSLLETESKECEYCVEPGRVVLVYTKKRQTVGVVVEQCEKPSYKCIPIEKITSILFPSSMLEFLKWIERYYLCGIGRAVSSFAPGFFWKWETIHRFESSKIQLQAVDNLKLDGLNLLNSAQAQVYKNIVESQKKIHLIFGTTGSGKTEIYMHLAQKTLSEGKRVLVLIPEIALTQQMISRFSKVFGSRVGVLNSSLSSQKYKSNFFSVLNGQTDVLLGVRTSAVVPIRNLGLIIVDEEHDGSYKSQEYPHIHSRDVAVKRAYLENAVCVLGSATPSLESYHNAKIGKYELHSINFKYSAQQTKVYFVDPPFKANPSEKNKQMSSAFLSVNNPYQFLSEAVVEALKETKSKNEQSMIIYNRRGYSRSSVCIDCKKPNQCPNCAVSLTIHQNKKTKHEWKEFCHYCDYNSQFKFSCKICGSLNIQILGAGTQLLEEALSLEVPWLKTSRLDRDVLTSGSRIQKILGEFREGKTDCLIGTQMLAKGHDFPKVSLIVLLYLEDGLFLPDYRSSEKVFSLVNQSMGRVARGNVPGLVYVQSFLGMHPLVVLATENKVEEFIFSELNLRKLAWLPPFCRQILIEINHAQESNAFKAGEEVKKCLILFWKENNLPSNCVRASGPFPAPLEKIRNLFRFHLCVSFEKKIMPSEVIPKELFVSVKRLSSRYLNSVISINVDPQSFL
jgi:primosomal protein N' (replication factor Y) (superfamily II helicase)